MLAQQTNNKNIWGNTGGQAQVPNTGFNKFNSRTAGNAQKYLGGQGLPNVWAGANQRFQGMTDQLGGQLFGANSPWGSGGGGVAGSWGYRPSPNDPTLQGYQQNLMGGGRNMSDQFIKQAATAGPNRGGMNVVGGGDPRSQMAFNATKALAGNYGDTYSKAYDMASRDYSAMRDMWGQGANLYGQLAGNELGALRGASDYNLGQGNIGLQLNAQNLQGLNSDADNQWKYWKDITDYQRGEYDRNFNREQQRIGANQAQSMWQNKPVDPMAQIPMLESTLAQYNTRFPYGDSVNMQHKSDLMARLQGTGPYGSQVKKSSQAQFSGQPGF